MTRKEALKELNELREYCEDTFLKRTQIPYLNALDMAIKALEQEPKTGHWIEQIDYEENCRTLICSNCDRPALHDEDSIWKHKFCPHCGAKMVEPQETETWNSIHAQITAPKGTFERIFNEADDDSDI